MRIDSLTIQNFKGFELCEIAFDPHFNLLVGDNAAGKTSVLDALAIAVDSWFLGLNIPEKAGGILQEQVRIVTHSHQDSWTFEEQFPSRIEVSGIVIDRPLTWARALKKKRGLTTSVEAKNIREVAAATAKGVRGGQKITIPLICSYGTERLWFQSVHYKNKRRENSPSSLPSRLDGYKDCNVFEIQETELLEWLRAEYLDGLSLGLAKTIAFRAFEKALVGCVEEARSLVYLEKYSDALVDMGTHGHQFFKNLSDGQRIMLTLVGDLVRRATTLNPHLGDVVLEETPGVVLIDELDLHLHPKWQRRVIHDLKRTFPTIQFITTTHSPQLIGEAQPHEIRILAEGKAFVPPRSFGLDSSRVLEEVQGAVQRNPEVKSLILRVSEAIEKEKFNDANGLLDDLEGKLGPDDAEVTRARALMSFLESPI